MTIPENVMMATINHLSQNIGIRPPLSQEEYEAMQYIRDYLSNLGINTEEQPFYSSHRLIQRLLPAGLLANLGMALGTSQNRWKRNLGGLISLFAGFEAKRAQQGKPTIAEMTVIPQRRALNLIARILPNGQIQNRVILIAHVDTDKQRLSGHPKIRELIPDLANTLSKISLWGTGLFDKKTPQWLRKLMFGGTLAQSALIAANEIGNPLNGSNDNASGIAVLLCLAETLVHQPLHNTEVILAFTSCDTLYGRGTAELVAQYTNDWHASRWIVVDNVGSGELCWMTDNKLDHSISISNMMQQIAHTKPEWGIMGRSLSVPNPAEPLLARHLNAATVMGYERMSAFPENWRQTTDNIENISLTTLEKTRQFLSATLISIDEQVTQDIEEALVR